MTDTTTYGLIYKTTNLINGKIYIGQTTDTNKFYLKKYKGSGILITNAIKKYKWKNFTSEILAYASHKDELDGLEKLYITKYNSLSPVGYNIDLGCNGVGRLSVETKKKISETLKIRRNGNQNPFYGKKHTNETRAKIREKMSGRKLSLKTIDKMCAKKLSDIHKKNISVALQGHKYSLETLNKMRESAKNSPVVMCPYCGKSGRVQNMKQWHFDRCKNIKSL